jgi:hypothetical protein
MVASDAEPTGSVICWLEAAADVDEPDVIVAAGYVPNPESLALPARKCQPKYRCVEEAAERPAGDGRVRLSMCEAQR